MTTLIAAPGIDVISGAELYELGDIGPCELVAGKIMPQRLGDEPHGAYIGNFYRILHAFVDEHKLGKVRVGAVGVYTRRNPDTVRGADALFISHERSAKRQSSGYLDVAPDLIVEVMSPTDRWKDVTQKLREYFGIGVRLVWVADPDAQIVYAYRSVTDVREFAADQMLPGDDVLPGFAVPVARFFEE